MGILVETDDSVSTTDVGVLVKVPRWLLFCDHEEGGEGEHCAELRGSHFERCRREDGESRSPCEPSTTSTSKVNEG